MGTVNQKHWELASRLTSQFSNRTDIHARQLPDGRYYLVRQPFTSGLMYSHLQGKVTLGTYLLDKESHAKFMVLDSDEDITGIRDMHTHLQKMTIPCYLETSRRGGHLWFFFADKVSGELARGFGLALATEHGLQLEVFPKQTVMGTGPGSLIRVPFGIHRKSGQRYEFLGLGSMREQAIALSAPDTVGIDIVKAFQYHEHKPNFKTDGALRAILIADFIGRYIDLRPVASGFVGLCPFHHDQMPSFGVNVDGNYWHCFAGCGGGDIVSFWMRWRGIENRQATEELRKILHISA